MDGLTRAERIAAGSIALGAVVFGLKALAWWLTGSAALYSDALESVVNVAASAVALWAMRYAAKPADAEHPYGHAKAEFFAAVVEGSLIVAAAVLILEEAWSSWRAPSPLVAAPLGLGANLLATLMNAFWAVLLFRTGRRARSTAMVADARHLVSDVVTSAGVLIGFVAALLTGEALLDPVLAALVALYVLWSGLRLIRESVGGLMDEAPAPAIVERIRTVVGTHAAGAIEAHDLRTRHAGRLTFVEFHLVVPGSMRVDEAHAICDRIEGALREEMSDLVTTIHVEPDGKAKHKGVLVL